MQQKRSFYGVDVAGEVFRFRFRGTANRVRRIIREVVAASPTRYAKDPEALRRLVRLAEARPHRRTKRFISEFVLYHNRREA